MASPGAAGGGDAAGDDGGAAAERRSSAAAALMPFGMVFGGCMSAVVAMEYVLKRDPHAGNLLTLSEFAFVLAQSIPDRVDRQTWSLKPLRMPWSCHALHAGLWVSMSILVNYVFGFNISVPLHTLFRSCNVIASALLGWLAFGQRYTLRQLACVVVITVGIFLGSIGDARQFQSTCNGCGDGLNGTAAAGSGASRSSDSGGDADGDPDGLLRWSFGVAMLVLVQVIQACLGHAQAGFYSKYQERGTRGELAEEFLFTSHVASLLPLLLLLRGDIVAAGLRALDSPPAWPGVVPVPVTLLWMLLNNLFQVVCIKGVFRLAATHSPLTVNITLSVRKFSSVVLSILWFGNAWTSLHSLATVAIFGGVFAYSQCAPPPPPAASKEESRRKRD
eukprot:TRINITY_DN10510_c0_g5_i2.p1 TRINITY_DN10510_c0_g5~~TRINITY_DN10510_c0_g5_i2.p1  ORF type:complete len:423 (+),score=113.57 TRINITY_DN10510_c0_g5_i2:100-1269(+)